MFIITTMRNIDLHPVNYFFLAAAFFASHLLLAYLVDHISIHAAFLICSMVSVFLVVSYLRLVVGPRFALLEAGGAQFIYLVLFSYAFFLQGFTGLAVGALSWAPRLRSPLNLQYHRHDQRPSRRLLLNEPLQVRADLFFHDAPVGHLFGVGRLERALHHQPRRLHDLGTPVLSACEPPAHQFRH